MPARGLVNYMFYTLAKNFLWLYCSVLFRIKCEGRENIPKKGAVIFCANHSSNYDPVIVGAFSSRAISFMAKKELYCNPFMRRLLAALKTFPVDRSKTDMNAFRKAIEILKTGGAIGIFAQGTRVKSTEQSSQKSKAGVSLFALKGGAPVVPVGISGEFKPFSKIYIRFGKPITLDEYREKKADAETLNAIAEGIMEKVEELRIK